MASEMGGACGLDTTVSLVGSGEDKGTDDLEGKERTLVTGDSAVR